MIFKRVLSLVIIVLLFAVSFSSCKKQENIKISEMTLEELEEHVSIGEYKNVEILCGELSKQEALLLYIDKNSTVKRYPKSKVAYYVEQLQKQYRYYAEQAGMKYEAMLDELGEDNVTMNAEAKRLVKNDLVFELIRKKEGIKLTDEEKAQFFDRYVKKYAESYKYSEEYVRTELSELVYDSMLYDKTVEFLIIHNSFLGDTDNDNSSNSSKKKIEIKVSEGAPLLLSEDVSFSNSSTSFVTEKIFLTNISVLDIPNKFDDLGGSHNAERYFAYTFYLKNSGTEVIDICSDFVITSVSGNIDEVIRIKVYRDGTDTGSIYAKLAKDGSSEYNTTPFLSDESVFSLVEENVESGKVIKYTLVIWLEGDDAECVDDIKNDSIDMSLNFFAKK